MSKTLSMMGLAKKAGKLISGRCAVMKSVKGGAATAVLLTADASPRHKKELETAGFRGKTVFLEESMNEAGYVTGRRSCIFAVEDGGFADAIEKTLNSGGYEDGCKI